MIQFFIENQEVILPDDFSFTQIDENPLITNNGEFTLDITVSLRNAKNAKAAKFINRINKIDIDTSYNALMIDDGKYKHGTIIIQSHTNTDMTFQFVAGNSELNYNYLSTDSTKKIFNFPWGTESNINYDRAMQSLQKTKYEDGNFFVCAPVKVGGDIANDYSVRDATADVPCIINGVSNIIMQPYLMYYIERLPSLLGYSMKYNVLKNDIRANSLYIVNGVQSLNYSDCLPDMTISEFVDAIEKFFNVCFYVDNKDKSLSIHSLSSAISQKEIVNASVVDGFERDISDESKSVRLDFTRISYDLEKNGLFLYQDLESNVVDNMSVVEFQTELLLKKNTYISADSGAYKFYRDLNNTNDYILCSPPTKNIFYHKTNLAQNIYLVNKLRPYGSSDDRNLILKLVPAVIMQGIKNIKFSEGMGADANSDISFQLPVSGSSKIIIPSAQTVIERIESGQNDIDRRNKLECSLYMGLVPTINLWDNRYTEMEGVLFPFSYIDYYPEYGFQGYTTGGYSSNFNRWKSWVYDIYIPRVKTSMKLVGQQGIVSNYHHESVVDSSRKCRFDLIDNPNVNSDNIFIIKNNKYLPISLERTKSRKKGLVKGTFYRML